MVKFLALKRGLALATPAFLAAGGLMQASRTPLNFSATVSARSSVPMWVITLDVLLLSIPFVLSGLWGMALVWRHTRGLFRWDVVYTSLGLIGVLPNILVLFLFRQRLESSFSYSMVFHHGVSAGNSLAVTLLAALVWAGFVSAMLAIYANGVISEGSGKYDKRPGEPDAIGALISEMKG
jgi:hypothetical protein